MLRSTYSLSPLLLLVLFSLCPLILASDLQPATRVIDGDTFVLAGGEKVRLIGVDTPETVHPSKPVEFFGKEASAFTRRMLDGKKVRLEFDVQRRDRYGRLLGYVYLEDGTFLNAELVRQGYAQVATYPPNVKHTDLFVKLQREAREAGRGLWGAEPDSTAAGAVSDTTTVYVTKSGTKYHRDGCRHLSRSKIRMPLGQAALHHGPCRVCSPPTLKGAEVLPVSPAAQPGRCQAITKKGTQCKRKAKPGSKYCWQHGG